MGNYRDKLIAAMVVFLVINTLAIGARLYVRVKLLTRAIGIDDLMLCLVFSGYVIHCGLESASMYWGYAAPDGEKHTRYDSAKATKLLFANQLTIYICAGLVKLAVACILLRIVTKRALRWLLYFSIFLVIAWTIVMTLYASWLCASDGSSNYAGSKTCMYVGYFRTSTNIIIDYFYALLPVYILWNVQMSLKLKLSVLLLLGMGAFASSATIVKLVIIIQLRTAEGARAKGLHYDLLLWADIELGMATFAASAAALRPLLLRIPAMIDTYFSKTSSRRAPQSNNSGIHGMGPYQEVEPASTTEDVEMGRLHRSISGTQGGITKTTTLAVRIDSKQQVQGPSSDTFPHL